MEKWQLTELRESVPNFKINALAVRKLKGKEYCEKDTKKDMQLCTETNVKLSNFDGFLYQLRK